MIRKKHPYNYLQTADSLAEAIKNVGAKRVAILGGSFNPPHAGHMKISELAIKLCKIDLLVWLVTPQNPFKDPAYRNNLEQRLEYCFKHTKNKDFYISDMEKNLVTPYETSRTLKYIHQAIPKNVETFWIMGADNLSHIHTWEDWHYIFEENKVITFDRDNFFDDFASSEASKAFPNYLVYDINDENLSIDEYQWVYIKGAKIDISSTGIRAGLKSSE